MTTVQIYYKESAWLCEKCLCFHELCVEIYAILVQKNVLMF